MRRRKKGSFRIWERGWNPFIDPMVGIWPHAAMSMGCCEALRRLVDSTHLTITNMSRVYGIFN